jgi:long-chain acyl-CoA synthetase
MVEVHYQSLRQMFDDKVEEYGPKTYLAFYDDEISFRAFDRQVNRFANALLKLGIKKGDIVCVYANNSPDALAAYFGIVKTGAIGGPINCWWQPPEIKYLLNDSRAVAAVVESCYLENIERIRPECPHLKTIIELGDQPTAEYLSFHNLVADNPEQLGETDIAPEDDAFIFYTSGTTGNPKGVLLTHYNALHALISLEEGLRQERGEEVALIFLPIFHVNAMFSCIAGINGGVTIVLRTGFSASEFWEVVEKHRVTFWSAVPAVYNILLQIPETAEARDLSSVKFGICGAAPMPVETFRAFEETFGIKIIEGYGLTEGTVASAINPVDGKRKIGSIGKPLPGQEIKILDDGGNELPPNEVGELCIAGGNVMKGYLRKPEANAETLRDGWLRTGDMAYKDEEGYLFIVDRKKEMIIRGGENIYPKEIDNLLFSHPKILEAAVVGVPDTIMGEEVKAYVVLKSGETMTDDEVRRYCQENLASFKVPRYVEFIDELPKNIIGKTLKKHLKQQNGGQTDKIPENR